LVLIASEQYVTENTLENRTLRGLRENSTVGGGSMQVNVGGKRHATRYVFQEQP